MSDNPGYSYDNADTELNGTYTIDQAQSIDIEGTSQPHNDYHMIEIPVTPRDVDTGGQRLPPIGLCNTIQWLDATEYIYVGAKENEFIYMLRERAFALCLMCGFHGVNIAVVSRLSANKINYECMLLTTNLFTSNSLKP